MRTVLLTIALVLTGCANTSTSASVADDLDPSVYGRWKSIEAKIYRADGTTTTQTELQCVLEASKDRTVSECSFPDGRKSRVVAKIVLPTPSSYELEVIEHDNNPGNAGLRSKVEYRLVGNRLFTTVFPPQRTPVSSNSPVVRIEVIHVRD